MTTELQQQLKTIALPDLVSKKKVTLIFSEDEARGQTIETVYNVGKNGLYELIRIEPDFIRFDTTLFGVKYRSMDRFLETEKVNQDLDTLIRDFLYTLSPYVMLKASQKCLEYLIRHFYIHIKNVSDVVMMILPYHETTLFPKIIELLEVQNDIHWYFLLSIKRTKVPLLRQYIGSQCAKDQGLLEFILKSISTMANEHYNVNIHLTFLCAFIFDYFKVHKITESEARFLISFILEGIKHIDNKEYQSTAYLLLCHLTTQISLDNSVLLTLLQVLFKYHRLDSIESILQTYMILSKSVSGLEIIQSSLSYESFYEFLQNDGLIHSWEVLVKTYDMSPLISLLMSSSIHLFCEQKLNYEFLKTLLLSMKEDRLSHYFEIILKTFSDILDKNTENNGKIHDSICILLRFLASQFPRYFDSLFTTLSVSYPSVNTILNTLFNGSEHMILDTGMTLYSGLHDSHVEIRSKACSALIQLLTITNQNSSSSEQTQFFISAILDLLHDENIEIIKQIVSIDIKLLLSVLSPLLLCTELFQLLQSSKCIANTKESKVFVSLLLNLLTQIDFTMDSFPIEEALKALFIYLPVSNHSRSIHTQVIQILSKVPSPFCSHLSTLKPSNTLYMDLYKAFAEGLQEDIASFSLCQQLLHYTNSIIPSYICLHILITYCSLPNLQQAIVLPIYDEIFTVLEQTMKSVSIDSSELPEQFESYLTPSSSIPHNSKEILIHSINAMHTMFDIMDFSFYSSVSIYGKQPDHISHPLLILIYLLSLSSTSKLINSLINYLNEKVSKTHPISLYLDALSLSYMYPGVFEKILKLILAYIQSLNKLYKNIYEPIYSVLFLFLSNEIYENRELTLSIFDTIAQYLIKEDATSIHSNSYVQFTQFIMSIKDDILKDGHYFSNYMTKVLLNQVMNISTEQVTFYNSFIIKMVLNTKSIYRKAVTLSIIKSVRADESDSCLIADILTHYFDQLHYEVFEDEHELVQKSINDNTNLNIQESFVHMNDVKLFKLLIRVLIRSTKQNIISQTVLYPLFTQYLQYYKTYSYVNVKKNIVEQCTPALEFIRLLDSELFKLFDLNQQYTLYHLVYSILYSPCIIENTSVFTCLKGLLIPYSIYVREANAYIHKEISNLNTVSDTINALTLFIETYKCSKFTTEMTSLNMLSDVLTWLLNLLPNQNAISIETSSTITITNTNTNTITNNNIITNNNTNNDNNDIDMNDNDTQITSDYLIHSSSYILQSIIECMYQIIHTYSNTKKHTTKNNNQEEDTSMNKQLSSRKRSGSFTITVEQDIPIQPSLLVLCIQKSPSLQVTKTTLRLLGILCEMQKDSIFPYLLKCLQQLVQSLYIDVTNQYEYLKTIFSILNIACPYLKDTPTYIIQLYKLIIPCILYMPENQASSLSMQLINVCTSRYLPHFIVYLLTVYAGYDLEGKQLQNDTYNVILENDQCISIPINKKNLYHFMFSFIQEFSIAIQIQCILYIIASCEYIPYDDDMDALIANNNETNNIASKSKNPVFAETVQSIINNIPKSIIMGSIGLHFLSLLLHLIQDITTEEVFITSITNLSQKEENSIQNLFLSITEYLLLLLQICNDSISSNVDQDLELWQQCQEYIYTIIGIINELMYIPAFITVISELLNNEEMSVRRRALQMLNTKLESSYETLSKEEQHLFLDLIEDVDDIITNPEESLINKQTAVLSLHVLAQYFGTVNPSAFIPSLVAILSIINNMKFEERNQEIEIYIGSIYMCLSVLLQKMGNIIIKYINTIIKPFLNHFEYYLQYSIQSDSILLYQSFLSLLYSLVVYQSKFISPYLHRIMMILLNTMLLNASSNNIQKQLLILYEAIPKYIPTRLLLPEMEVVLNELNFNSICISKLYFILQLLCDTMDNTSLLNFYIKIWNICLSGLNSRMVYDTKNKNMNNDNNINNNNNNNNNTDVNMNVNTKNVLNFKTIESSVVDCMIHLIIRLNEKQFKPLFISTVEWTENKYMESKEELPPLSRCIAFYTFMYELTKKLKSISVPYYSYIHEITELICSTLCKQLQKKQNTINIDDIYLLTKIVDCLYLSFKFDTIHYIDENKFNNYHNLLITFYKCIYLPNGMNDYKEIMLQHVTPAITELVACTSGHDIWWKQLNYDILLFTREENSTIKYIALKNIQDCCNRVSQEYITLIPDIIPFLANLLEDSDIEVEKLAHDVKIQLETISGEQLDSFLTV